MSAQSILDWDWAVPCRREKAAEILLTGPNETLGLPPILVGLHVCRATGRGPVSIGLLWDGAER